MLKQTQFIGLTRIDSTLRTQREHIDKWWENDLINEPAVLYVAEKKG